MINWKTARESLPHIPPGKMQGEPPTDEAEHFMECGACGGWFDMRDLSEVFRHEEPGHEPSPTH